MTCQIPLARLLVAGIQALTPEAGEQGPARCPTRRLDGEWPSQGNFLCAQLERKSGVIQWTDDVSLVYAGSNCQADVSRLMRLAVDHFRQVGVTVLGRALTPCGSVGCLFVWAEKEETKRTIEKWVS